mmetsp:Transcript_6978/g.11208  ORF Transcript_6978/g.11208 Transcript_6978/m.11208 type:complete len:216 (-) Transcript_6978:7-654(-)
MGGRARIGIDHLIRDPGGQIGAEIAPDPVEHQIHRRRTACRGENPAIHGKEAAFDDNVGKKLGQRIAVLPMRCDPLARQQTGQCERVGARGQGTEIHAFACLAAQPVQDGPCAALASLITGANHQRLIPVKRWKGGINRCGHTVIGRHRVAGFTDQAPCVKRLVRRVQVGKAQRLERAGKAKLGIAGDQQEGIALGAVCLRRRVLAPGLRRQERG